MNHESVQQPWRTMSGSYHKAFRRLSVFIVNIHCNYHQIMMIDDVDDENEDDVDSDYDDDNNDDGDDNVDNDDDDVD